MYTLHDLFGPFAPTAADRTDEEDIDAFDQLERLDLFSGFIFEMVEAICPEESAPDCLYLSSSLMLCGALPSELP